MLEYLELLEKIFISNGRYMYIFKGLIFSIGVTALATILGIILGILIALLQLSEFYPFKNSKKLANFNPLSKIAFLYVNILRGTPVVVQLMIWANVIFIGNLRDTPILIIAAIAFGINSGAYVAEIIIPQAIKKILPPLVSEFIALLKETSVVGFIGGVDLLRSANIITSQTYRGVEPLIAVGIIYFILTSVFAMFMRKVEEGLRESD